MKLGISLPTAGSVASTDAITHVAEEAERIGLHSVWAFERQLSPVGEIRMGERSIRMPAIYDTVYSPMEALAFAAAKTSTVRLGTSVIVALLHNPVALARSFATLDQLSNGRAVAGLGQGWMQAEFDAAGVDKSRQGAGFGEFIEAMRAMWAPDPVEFNGSHYTVTASKTSPKPVRSGGPPILVGAGSPASIRRTAGLGLGLNPIWFGWDALKSSVEAFHHAARDAGHNPAQLPVVLRVNEPLTESPSGGEASPAGSPEQAAELLPRLEDLGVTEVFWSSDAPVDEQLGLVEELVGLTAR